jgi:hypothetical protein
MGKDEQRAWATLGQFGVQVLILLSVALVLFIAGLLVHSK